MSHSIVGLNPVYVHTIAISVVDAAASQTDSITIDGVVCKFTSDATPTTTEISTGLRAAIAASSAAGKFVVTGTTNVVLTPAGGYNPGVTASVNLTDVITIGTLVLGSATISSMAALVAGEAHVGEVGGSTLKVAVTPTITAGAYHANDVVGGIQTFANAARVSGGTGKIDTIVVRDLAAQNVVLQIFFFSATPGTGTYTDNAAMDLDDTDSALCLGHITVAATDYISLADNSIATMRNVGLDYTCAATSLFALIRTTGTPTYVSTSDLIITIHFLRN